ncbi:MAG: hypothetical protein WC554_13265 [Clostridia bacterium]|jgi:hypothetical protein
MILIGFDFSCNKTACCILQNNKYSFCLWPLEMDEKSIVKFKDIDVYVNNRSRIKEGITSSEKFRWHVTMANDLTLRIISYLKLIIKNENVVIAFEGSSFASRGDAALQLAGYRYILVNELGKLYGLENIFTFAPMTVKSTAHCASKDKKGKDSMISAFSEEMIYHPLCTTIKNNPALLKKKTNYISGIDDLADSFFVLKTLSIKENFGIF